MTNIYVLPQDARFAFGGLYVTAAADATLSRDDIATALSRHARGDWGDVGDEDRTSNDAALASDGRLLSVYHDRNGLKFWIITEWDRSATTVLLPDDY